MNDSKGRKSPFEGGCLYFHYETILSTIKAAAEKLLPLFLGEGWKRVKSFLLGGARDKFIL
ncbi:hypothetical protein [Pontibacter vulgaris]|uniref:hypothetical protein n=1 Tax=Pontibacter vulgaris TaxID=2905679 RepID=UPI001FA6E670|nr:hypothetical protein [Pontibacter vulgaris]